MFCAAFILHFRRTLRWAALGFAFAALLASAALVYAWTRPFDPAPYLVQTPCDLVVDREERWIHAFLNEEDHLSFPQPRAAFSRWLVAATLAAEDQRFYAHPGVDLIAIARAALQNAGALGVRSGASTLTMQLVKLQSDTGGGVAGKLRQAWRALRLERYADKDTLLAAYLNTAPYGRNLLGAEAAARRYFDKPAAALNIEEAALLAGLPKSPTRLDPLLHPVAAQARRDYVLRRMHAEGAIDADALARALAAPLGAQWHDYPALAPQLARRLRTTGEAATTLDARLQAETEARLRRYLRQYNGRITNGAVLVVDVPTAQVRAWVGSAGFHDTPGGQLDLAQAPRSPGSTLKPFTYALALADQRLYPSEVLLDDTVDFGHYAPGNFSGTFTGLVPARDALRHSLNVPAIALLNRIGTARLHGFLRETGFATLRQTPEHYGLGLTLGNCSVRLDELAADYTMLANLGVWRPLRVTSAASPGARREVLPPDVAAAVFYALEQRLPGAPDPALVRTGTPTRRAAYKTGTSTGFHDAWCFVFDRQSLVAVWLGNADGRPAPDLVGAQAALPLAAAIFEALPKPQGSAWPSAADYTRATEVCARSGLPASAWCPATRQEAMPTSLWLHRRCALHWPGMAEGAVAEAWPARPQEFDLAAVAAPAHVAAASRARSTELRIVSPADGAEYVLTGEPGGDVVTLRASRSDAEALSWYVDGKFAGTSAPRVPILWPLTEGAHTVSVMSGNGATHQVRYTVSAPGGRFSAVNR